MYWARETGERTGYRGAWTLGLDARGLRGFRSNLHYGNGHWPSGGPAYDADVYRETTTAMHAEMLEQPGEVALRLVGRLVRGLATDRRWVRMLRPEQ